MIHNKKKVNQAITNYVHQVNLKEDCFFSQNSTVSFHWANDKVATNVMRHLFKTGEQSFQDRISELKCELEILKSVPVWLMGKRGMLKSTLHNLYLCYLDPRLKHQWFEIDDILVSTQNDNGPFCSLKSLRWFEKNIYAKFIYLKMLENWVPQRDFRMNLNIPFTLRADGSPFGSIAGTVCQMNDHGILVNIINSAPLAEWDQKEVFFVKNPVRLNKDEATPDIFRAQAWINALENFTVKGEVLRTALNRIGPHQGDAKNYIFIPFSDITMLSIRSHEDALSNLKGLFKEARNDIHASFQKAA